MLDQIRAVDLFYILNEDFIMRKLLLLFVFLLLCIPSSFSATPTPTLEGPYTMIEDRKKTNTGSIQKIDLTWTCDPDGDGNFSITTSYSYTGRLSAVAIINKPTAPTTGYDINVYNSIGIDLLNTAGADIDSSTDSLTITNMGLASKDFLTFRITNAGAGSCARVILYIKEED
jgi:hypothetical protein